MSTPVPVAGLTLRPWRDDDAAALVAAADDPLLERWTRVRVAEKSGCAYAGTPARREPYPQEGHLHLYQREAHVGIATAG